MNGAAELPTEEVTIVRSEKHGLGFNVVGGLGTQHLPGHNGIFVSKIRPESPAAESGRLNVGDRILRVNDIDLTNKTHDEAVEVFRGIKSECKMVIEPDAERILLSQPSNLIIPTASSPTANTARSRSQANSRSSSPRGSRAASPTQSLRPESPAPSVISVLDLPQTPKKPASVLDPANPSILTEVIFVSIGAIAIGLAGVFLYRFFRRR
ncbi:PDZ domain containing protein [Aphelenchoides fujianensis]|nr:PDZ domain containing protein [Aphelenchoides fujianensis]